MVIGVCGNQLVTAVRNVVVEYQNSLEHVTTLHLHVEEQGVEALLSLKCHVIHFAVVVRLYYMYFLSFKYGGSYLIVRIGFTLSSKLMQSFPCYMKPLCVVNTAALLAFNHSRW